MLVKFNLNIDKRNQISGNYQYQFTMKTEIYIW